MTTSGAVWLLLLLHAPAIAVAGLVGARRPRAGFVLAAVVPAATALWAAVRFGDDEPVTASLTWVEGLDLSFRFRIDDLAALMTVLVSGIGALVFVYATGYFSPGAASVGRFTASLLAFSTSMLGLVWADSVWTLFVFWEATSVTSFLLVGHKHAAVEVRAAARRALLITAGGGLALLAGLLLLAEAAGTTTISDLTPVDGTRAGLAAVLVLLGAATKSAQVPFHVWLPGAMAAPTPVSAYLHSATMVKAGVLLVAVTSPAFAETSIWKPLGLTLGLASMLWGAIGALRHVDAKLILAWGTVSQLGLLIALFSMGTGKATFAGVGLLFAHALFKAALFLVVGEIDIRTGTRRIDELGRLYRSMPIATAVAVLAGLSMAGVPPLLGFTAKEAAIEAALGLDGDDRELVTALVLVGSTLTVAYTVRFLITVFGPGPTTTVAPRRLAMTVPAAILGGAGLVLFVFIDPIVTIVRAGAVEIDPSAEVYSLIRWPGITTAFVWSMVVVAVGTAIGAAVARGPLRPTPSPVGASATDAMLDGVLDLSRRVTARVQHGSLPVYLVTMAATASLATLPFLVDLDLDAVVLWDHPLQAVGAAAVVAAAFAGAFVSSRLGAALTLGAVGVGVSGIFIVHGAPDLALTQLLVETVVVVGFVAGLGHLGRRFPPVGGAWKSIRITIAGLMGLGVMAALAASAADPSGRPPIERLTTESVEDGGGNNVVNVILTDVRALDTMGEVVVILMVALGVLALANTERRDSHEEVAS